IYHYLRGRMRCGRRNRGYGNEISSHHSSCGGFPSIEGHGSFFCGGEGSVVYSRGASSLEPRPTSSTYSVSGGYRSSGDGSIVISSSDSRGTSGWGIARGTVSVYGGGRGTGYSSEDSCRNIIGSGGGGGSGRHCDRLGITAGEGSGYGYDSSPRCIPGAGGGSGHYSVGSGYGMGEYSCPEFSSGGSEFSQVVQQKCPVVIPSIEAQQSKQSNHWPPSQKK
ncbi:PREDICTED: glycine-rich cell wall structural protein 2-like, partial [Nestor notabilis]|uniref:glycine-rich cell wall structural protein 2-like n=1 Tax=Nestor notabilis TaxID=176057 RepID=UPI000523A88C